MNHVEGYKTERLKYSPEWEDARYPGGGGAGGGGDGLEGAGGGLGVGAVAPVVGHHRAVGVHLGGAPGHRRGRVGAAVVLHVLVLEGEHALRPLQRHAGVGHPGGYAV